MRSILDWKYPHASQIYIFRVSKYLKYILVFSFSKVNDEKPANRRIPNWKHPHANKILLPHFIAGAKKVAKHCGKNLIGQGQELLI